MSNGCDCKADWRIQSVDLATGTPQRYIPFTSLTFEEQLNQVGNAQITVPVRKVSAADVWPHLRALAVTRIAGPNASPASPFGQYMTHIQTIDPESDGTLNIGGASIEDYLNNRIKENSSTHTAVSQTALGAALAGVGSGTLLTATSETSTTLRTITYAASNDQVLYDAITDLTELDGGPDYYLTHTYDTGSGLWSSVMTFTDVAGTTTSGRIVDKRSLTAYGMPVDASQHANWIRGRDQTSSFTQDNTGSSIYPRYDKAVQWSDVTDSGILQANTVGYGENNADPLVVPDVTISSLALSCAYNLGDTLDLDIDYGALRFAGQARLVSKAWSIQTDAPTTCTFSFVPVDSASATVLNAPAGLGKGCC